MRRREIFEKQVIVVSRLYDKIDYHKKLRHRIPLFSAIANFALVSITYQTTTSLETEAIFAVLILAVGFTLHATLEIVRRAFNRNVKQLRYLYAQMAITGERFVQDGYELAEDANPMWYLLHGLVLVAWLAPVSLLMLPALWGWVG